MDDLENLPLSDLAKAALADRDGAYTLLVAPAATPAAARAALAKLDASILLSAPAASQDHAQAMLAGLWLRHDALQECHEIAQLAPRDADAAASFNFWHAIMHRREGDFSNSKYWYARCRRHPARRRIAAALAGWYHDGASAAEIGLRGEEWDPNTFVDFVEAAHAAPGGRQYAAAAAAQKIEWRSLFIHCALVASGQPAGK